MKKLISSCLLCLFLALASCTSRHCSVVHASAQEGPSGDSYIEGCIAAGSHLKDTLLYYRFDVLSGAVVFKEKAGLNIGASYLCMANDSLYMIKLGFRALGNDRGIDTMLVLPPGSSRVFTTIPGGNASQGTETAFGFVKDDYHSPVTPAYLVSPENMKRFIVRFESELCSSVDGGDSLVYASVCHLDGYYQQMSMTFICQ